jgi:hypothetical protein
MGRATLSLFMATLLVVGIPSTSFLQEKSPEEQERKAASDSGVVEDIALGATSVVISAAQLPLRLIACSTTFVVAGIAYLFTIGSEEGRRGPAEAITTVCEGPYITTPQDLKGP